MKISIIIPTLNEAVGIAQGLRRALATKPHEVIVVDGGSTDATLDIARRYECRVFQCERGRAVQQNLGARRATGEVLLFLHADNWLVPGGVRQIERVLANPRISAGAFQHVIESDGLIYRVIEQGNSMRVRVLRMAYGDQGIFVRTAAFWQVGGFPEIRLMEDVHLIRKLRKLTPIALLPGPLFTSARRWQRYGPIRQTIRNWMLIVSELSGISPNVLASYYSAD